MILSYRTARVEDFKVCSQILRERFAFEAGVRERIPEIWRDLYLRGQIIFVVVEDPSFPPESRIVGFGASVFVTDSFIRELQDDPIPYSSRRVIDRILKNESPVLSHLQVQTANSGDGLNLLVLHHSWSQAKLNERQTAFVRMQIVQSFVEYHHGYNLKEIISEVIGKAEIEWIINGSSFRLRDTYEIYYKTHPLPPPELRSYLIGITRAESYTADSVLAPLFIYSPPRFFFRRGEQELLQQALSGKTDEELVNGLGISLSAVKKRWNSIYHRVAGQDAELLPDPPENKGQKRGAQKKHLLLNYLRRHPEELRP